MYVSYLLSASLSMGVHNGNKHDHNIWPSKTLKYEGNIYNSKLGKFQRVDLLHLTLIYNELVTSKS